MSVSTTGLLAAGRRLAGLMLILVSACLLLVNGAYETAMIWTVLGLVSFAAGLGMLGVSRSLAGLWLVYYAGFLLFIKLRLYADDVSPIAALFDYVIRADMFLFGGRLPTLEFQDRFYDIGTPTPLIIFLVIVYISYAFVPHAVALLLSMRKPLSDFRRYVAASLITYYAAVAVAFLLPTGPPWLAGQLGYTRHVYRVVFDVLTGAESSTYSSAYPIIDGNSVAAMPSLHMGIAVLSAIGLGMFGRRLATLGVVYAVLMSIALVTLGEHYVVDILAGILLSVLAWRFADTRAIGRLPGS